MLKDNGNSTCCVDKDEKSKIKLEEFKLNEEFVKIRDEYLQELKKES